MARQLKVEFVQSGVHDQIGTVQGTQILIGREPDDGGIAVPSQAVSRNHGIFVRFRNHWFFKDLGSTNGSWVNGIAAKEGVWKLIRSGDILQLADAVISLSEENSGLPAESRISGFPALGGVSLLVFSKGEFLDEYPVPEYGRALVIGGSQGDLQIDGALEEMPTLVIERRSMNVCAFTVAKSLQVHVNSELLTGSLNLNDRDEISASHYHIIFNSPVVLGRATSQPEAGRDSELAQGNSSSAGRWKEWADNDRRPDLGGLGAVPRDNDRGEMQRGVFGRAAGIEDETVAIDPSEVESKIAGYDMHPSMRYVMDEPEPVNMSHLDEKIIFGIGVILMLGILGLTVYWLVV